VQCRSAGYSPRACYRKINPIFPQNFALIGTFDNKGEEFSFLPERIESPHYGHIPVVYW
jgi:hypothetical protein